MTNKVLEIQSIFKNSTIALAEGLCQKYERLRIQKQQFEEELKEVRDYVFATDTTTTTNSTLPWRNTTHIPKIAQIRDNLHAHYMDALFPNNDWLIWDGDDQDSVNKEKRRIIETYTKNKAIQSGIRETFSDLIYDWIDTGNLFAEVIWVDERHFDPVLQEEFSTYVGPKLRRISPYDHVFDATASSYAKAPKFTRYLKSVGELRKEMKVRTDLHFDEKVVKEILEMRKTIAGYDMEDINKAEGYLADGFGSLSEYYASGLVEIIEFEGDWYDVDNDELMENRIITIIDGTKILRNIENPNWLGRDNKIHVGWRDRPDNLYSMGPLANLVGMQYRVNHLENLKAEALDFSIFPVTKVKGDVEPFTWAPKEQIRLPEDGDVEAMPPNPAAFQVNNEIGYYLELMEEYAGAPKQAMGIRTPGEKTATEVQTLESNSGRIFQSKTNKLEAQGLEPALNLFLESAKRNVDTKDIVKVMDDDFGVVQFLTITRDDITAKGKIRPVGARHFAQRALLMQNLNGVHGGALGPLLNAHTSRKALTNLVSETMGLDKFQLYKENIGVIEETETQKLVQQSQTTIQSQASVPLEENMV